MRLDGDGLQELFRAAAGALAAAAEAINAINVYPVPDGDTGSNMAATMRAAAGEADGAPPGSPPKVVAGAAARGALYGARGNSGVILSQALRGFADGIEEAAELDAAGLARGLVEASRAAYRAVSRPQEGTMLTVLREAAAAAASLAASLPGEGRGHSCLPVLEQAVAAAAESEARTPELLDSLREAGVPDAGGEGICVALSGMLARLRGEPVEYRERAGPGQARAFAAAHAEEASGFCTEFLLEPDGGGSLDPEAIRAAAEAGGRSVVIVGDGRLVRVHLHTEEPERLIARMRDFGRVQRVKIDDMGAQRGRFEASGSGATAVAGLLAISRGAGFDRIFESLGAKVLDLGTVEKPAAGDIAAAAERIGTADVVVLPNHPNVLLAAEQARTLARCTMHIVPTRSLPQGVGAALAYDPAQPARELIERMAQASSAVRTVEVTRAAADRTVEGVGVRRGEAIAVVEGRLVAAADSLEAALVAGLREAGAGPGMLISVYAGEDGDLETARAAVQGAFPGAEIEVIDGGQPIYPYIGAVER